MHTGESVLTGEREGDTSKRTQSSEDGRVSGKEWLIGQSRDERNWLVGATVWVWNGPRSKLLVCRVALLEVVRTLKELGLVGGFRSLRTCL